MKSIGTKEHLQVLSKLTKCILDKIEIDVKFVSGHCDRSNPIPPKVDRTNQASVIGLPIIKFHLDLVAKLEVRAHGKIG